MSILTKPPSFTVAEKNGDIVCLSGAEVPLVHDRGLYVKDLNESVIASGFMYPTVKC